ncbi:MAG: plasmid recombination protein [Defluviitaleaceae bacterium]|nr:plasmid recombination protein [Defluviitaleaceae bacterium]
MPHKTVVRNKAYQPVSFNTVERHNERKNEEYYNGDVQLERELLNVHFRRCLREDGTPETYQETFDRLLAEKVIVKHGTKPDAKLFCELVYDINTTYFDERGGYEYAQKFYEEAYREAVKEAGSEDYIISAVMHADERNSKLSDELGRDIYHYHLHVVYVPVVEKKLYFRKDNKDPELAGKLKEVIPQISQSNKWPLRMTAERDGKTVTRNSYSFLQDRYHEHMKEAGFDGFERGERGSTTEHLEVLDYKIQQEKIRAEEAAARADAKEKEAAAMDIKVEQKKSKISKLDEQIAVKEKAKAAAAEIDAMGKPSMLGNGFSVTADEMKTLKTLAKKSANADKRVAEANRKRETAEGERNVAVKELNEIKGQISEAKKNQPTISEHLRWFDKFIAAMRRAPKRLMEVIDDILRSPPERQEPQRSEPDRNRNVLRTEAR